MSGYKDFLRVNINEHSLFDDSNSKETSEFLNNDKLILDVFYINIIGFSALLTMDKHDKVTQYFKQDKKLQIRNITKDNNDISYIVKIINDKGLFTTKSVNQITKLFSLIKSGKIKTVDENKLRDILGWLKIDTNKPNPKVKKIVSKFISAEENLVSSSIELFKYARKNKISKEFTDIYKRTAKFKNIDLNDDTDADVSSVSGDVTSIQKNRTVNATSTNIDYDIDKTIVKDVLKKKTKKQITQDIINNDGFPDLEYFVISRSSMYTMVKGYLGKDLKYIKALNKMYSIEKDDLYDYYNDFIKDNIKITLNDIVNLRKVFNKKITNWILNYYLVFMVENYNDCEKIMDLYKNKLELVNTYTYFNHETEIPFQKQIFNSIIKVNDPKYIQLIFNGYIGISRFTNFMLDNMEPSEIIKSINSKFPIKYFLNAQTNTEKVEDLMIYISDNQPELLLNSRNKYNRLINKLDSIKTIKQLLNLVEFKKSNFNFDEIVFNLNTTWEDIFKKFGKQEVLNEFIIYFCINNYYYEIYKSNNIIDFLIKYNYKLDSEIQNKFNDNLFDMNNIDILLQIDNIYNNLDVNIIKKYSISTLMQKKNIMKFVIENKFLGYFFDGKRHGSLPLNVTMYSYMDGYYTDNELLDIYLPSMDVNDKYAFINIVYNKDAINVDFNIIDKLVLNIKNINFDHFENKQIKMYLANKQAEIYIEGDTGIFDSFDTHETIKYNRLIRLYLIEEKEYDSIYKLLEIAHKKRIKIQRYLTLMLYTDDVLKENTLVKNMFREVLKTEIENLYFSSVSTIGSFDKEQIKFINNEVLNSKKFINNDKNLINNIIEYINLNKSNISDDDLNQFLSNTKIFNEFRKMTSYTDIISKGLDIREDVKITQQEFKRMLEFNNIVIPEKINLRKKKTETPLEYIKRNAKHIANEIFLPEVKVEEVEETYEERMSKSYELYKKYHSGGKHGNTTFKILKTYTVNLPTDEFDKFRKEHPDSTMFPVFHGTGDIGAAFILRTGFVVIPSTDSSVTGRMLGDGIYFSNVIDKVQQYVGDSGMTRQWGSKGYVFEMDINLGVRGVDYRQDTTNVISAEWVVSDASKQIKILKAYRVELVDPNFIKQFNPDLKENVLENAKQILEGKMSKTYYNYIFMDGKIPVSKYKTVEFEKIKFIDRDVRITFGQLGPVLSIPVDFKMDKNFQIKYTKKFMKENVNGMFDQYLKLIEGKIK